MDDLKPFVENLDTGFELKVKGDHLVVRVKLIMFPDEFRGIQAVHMKTDRSADSEKLTHFSADYTAR